jgi:hypothetical protein
MFCELFGVSSTLPPPQPPPQPKVTKKPKRVTPTTTPQPSHAEQHGAPFKHVEHPSPEPAEYDGIHGDDWSDVDDDDAGFSSSEEIDAYEGGTTSVAADDFELTGSIGSSPGFFERSVQKLEKKRPPGIAVTFDDDSWIT